MSRFFSTESVQRLVRGSYERTIAKLEEALESDNLFGGCDAHILGTFSGYALVASDEGECVRIRYEDSGDKISIVDCEAVELPSYGANEVSDFLKEESARVLKLWKKGNLSEATERLRSLTSLAKSWHADNDFAYQKWEESLQIVRPWESLLQDKADEISEAIEEKIDLILRPKFRKLYDGSTSQEDLENYHGLVSENIDLARERLSTLQSNMTAAKNKVEALKENFEDKDVLSSLISFSEDLLEDLARIDTIVEGSSRFSNRVDRLGRIHDLAVGKITKAEFALNFVDTMATSLETEKVA